MAVLLILTEEARPGVMEATGHPEDDLGLDLVLDLVVVVQGAVPAATRVVAIAVVAAATQPPNRSRNLSPNLSRHQRVEAVVSLLPAVKLKRIRDLDPSPIEINVEPLKRRSRCLLWVV